MTRAEPALELHSGDLAPRFTLPDQTGAPPSLADWPGMKVLFFYPKADTPGCTTEAQDFSARSADFAAITTSVIGISADPVRKLARFRNRHALALTPLSDESHSVLRAYGAWGEKSMYGKTFEGIIRTTVLIGRNNRIAAIWRKVRVPGHADAVLAAARDAAQNIAFSEN